MWFLVAVALPLFLEIQIVSTKSLTSTENQKSFDLIAKNFAGEPLASRNSVEIICELPKREDYVYSNGIGAHKLHIYGRTWNEARKICKEENAHLAVVNSKAEELILWERLNKSVNSIVGSGYRTGGEQFAYLGVHKLFGNGRDWVTVTGDSLYATGYEDWSITQPENWKINEHCAAIYSVDGGMHDFNSNFKLPFFCELFLSCRLR